MSLAYLQTIVFILVIAALVQLVETVLRRSTSPSLCTRRWASTCR